MIDPQVAGVVADLQDRLDRLPDGSSGRRTFLATYLRTTRAVGEAVASGTFEDPAWVARWDVVFAGYFLAAHDADLSGDGAPRPWRLAFHADPALPPLRHLLLGLSAHLNYDLPQALLAVLSDADVADPAVMASRRRDHARIDGVLASRVDAEGAELRGRPRLRDTVLTPLNRWSTDRFLPRARALVWDNVLDLHAARLAGPEAYARRVADLDTLTAARVAGLLRPGPVLLRLALTGYGVRLPPA